MDFSGCASGKLNVHVFTEFLSNNEVTEFLLQLHRLLKSGVELDDALGFAVHEQKIMF